MKTIRIMLEDNQELFDDGEDDLLTTRITSAIRESLEELDLIEVDITDDWGQSPYKKKK